MPSSGRPWQPLARHTTPTEVFVSSVPRAAFATAVLVTVVEVVVLFASLASRPRLARETPSAAVERVEYIIPAPPRRRTTPGVRSTTGESPANTRSGGSAATGVVPLDAAVVNAPSPASSPARAAPAPVGDSGSAGPALAGPVLAPRGFSPSAPLTRRVIDSVLDSLNARMPALIWARVPTSAERDASYKESALAMRLSGRTLLVPADPHLAPGLSLPSVFSRRAQRRREVARVRTDSILAENMERLARLRERARRDSIRRDSLRRADSLPLPDARSHMLPW